MTALDSGRVGSTSEVTPRSHGPTARPEGEVVDGYARAGNGAGEADPSRLAERPYGASTSSAEPQGSAGGRGVTPEVEPQQQRRIVRATMRIRLDLRALSPDALRDADGRRVLSETETATRDMLRQAQRACATARNAVVRDLVRRDGDSLDAAMAKLGRMPHVGTEWPAPDTSAGGGRSSYALARQVAPELSGGVASQVAREVEQKWRQERWDVLVRQTRSPAHYKVDGPVPLRAADLTVVLKAGRYILKTRTHNKDFSSLAIPLDDGDDERVKAALGRLARAVEDAECWRHGSAMIEPDRKRPGRWYLRISYSRLVAMRTEGLCAAVHRGIRFFLVALTEDGDRWIYDGADIEAYLKQVQRRRRSYQNQSRVSARGGHGRKRTLLPTIALQEKAARWRASRMQTIARRLSEWLAARGVARVVIEDFSGIRRGEPERLDGGDRVWRRVQEWPYFEQGARLTSCLEEEGIATSVVPAHFNAVTCPKCGLRDDTARDLKRWQFRCPACKYREHLEIATARNVLARGKGGAGASGGAVSANGVKDFAGLPEQEGAHKRTARKGPRNGQKV